MMNSSDFWMSVAAFGAFCVFFACVAYRVSVAKKLSRRIPFRRASLFVNHVWWWGFIGSLVILFLTANNGRADIGMVVYMSFTAFFVAFTVWDVHDAKRGIV